MKSIFNNFVIAGLVSLLFLANLSAAPADLAAPVAPPAAASPTFHTFRVFLDPHEKPLAAWQFELTGPGLTIVGVEAGPGASAAGFSNPPYYDPAALQGGRIIISAYSLAENLPAARVQVATLHVMVSGELPKFGAKIMAAGTRDGTAIACDVSVVDGE